MREAMHYESKKNRVRCQLCPHGCLIEEGKSGICRSRRNVGGKLLSEGYGRISSMGMDPIEKKPLYHFYPGSSILSVGGLGCNFSCEFCQNWQIAHEERETVEASPRQLVDMALREESIGIAFTYNEPTIWYEYVYDTAKLAKQEHIKIVLVTNGYINLQPLEELLPFVDAMNIDVKAFTEEYYRKVCGGRLKDVKAVVEKAALNTHVEITTLVVGGLNDREEEMMELTRWLSKISPNIPLHLSRYFPNYKMKEPPTEVSSLYHLKDKACESLNYVYLGNMMEADPNTYCPRCGAELVQRRYRARVVGIKEGRCIECGEEIPIIY